MGHVQGYHVHQVQEDASERRTGRRSEVSFETTHEEWGFTGREFQGGQNARRDGDECEQCECEEDRVELRRNWSGREFWCEKEL